MFRQSSRQEQAEQAFDPLAEPPSLFPWAAVALGAGICLYFALRVEPSYSLLIGSGGIGGLCVLGASRIWRGRAVGFAVGLLLIGAALAGLRAHSVAAPVLKARYYGPVEGRVVALDSSASRALRITLDHVRLARIAPDQTPARVRLSLHGDFPIAPPHLGQRVMTTGYLSSPQGPVEPNGFDFRRLAWFQKLGAVGYTRNPVLLAAKEEPYGWRLWIYDQRLKLSQALQSRLPGPKGAFASAIITGDRAQLEPAQVQALRRSNLAHLLAISGLHMGLLTGLIFGLVRGGLALWPDVALQYPIRKWAALAAILVGAFYLVLSGASIATQRAFIMVSVMFVALLFDKRALSLRSVTMAALILMIWRPEAVLGAGFQMSFAATLALIVGFSTLNQLGFGKLPNWARPGLALFASSALAGVATAPIAAAHFNIIASYGFVANLLAVPAMGLVVMPGAILAFVLWPIGAEQLGLWIMGQGISWILTVAQIISQAEGGVRYVLAPSPVILPIMCLGGLGLLLGPIKLVRAAGSVAILIGIGLWSQTERPDVLISQSGALIAVRGPDGLVLSKERGEGFAAKAWLENDADPSIQAEAFARSGFQHSRARTDWSDLSSGDTTLTTIIQLRGKAAPTQAEDLCRAGVLIVSPKILPEVTGSCRVLDAKKLRETGSIAIWFTNSEARWQEANTVTGARPWTQ